MNRPEGFSRRVDRAPLLSRREALAGAGAIAGGFQTWIAVAEQRPDITLTRLLRAPLLSRFYRREPQGRYAPNGMVGLNIVKKTLVEDQRLGAEWVIRGKMAERQDWIDRGWKMLDIGVSWQMENGGFQPGYFHSNSLFLEGLARACIVGGLGGNPRYRRCLDRGARWMLDPGNLKIGLRQNRPYTHRYYIVAACLGQIGAILADRNLLTRAAQFADAGIAAQTRSGVNPELSGFDVSYQFVGALFALRYLPTAPVSLRARLIAMVSACINVALPLISNEGSIDTTTSTRAGREVASGVLKQPNYPEIFQALAYADVVRPTLRWREAAIRVARRAKLPLDNPSDR